MELEQGGSGGQSRSPARRDRALARTLVLGAVAVAIGLLGAWVGHGPGRLAEAVPHVVAGWSVTAAGLVAWWRAPWSRCGPLLVIAGMAWFVDDLGGCLNIEPFAHRCLRIDPVAGVIEQATWLWLAVLGHASATFPDGRARSTLERAAVIAGYLLALAIPAGGEPVRVLLAALLAGVPTLRWWLAARGEGRFEVAPSVIVGGGMAVVLIVVEVGPPYLLELSVALAAIGLVAGVVDVAGLRASLSVDRAVGLGGSLAAALRDPSFGVWFRAPDGAWADSAGSHVPAPRAGPAAELTWIERDGVMLAAVTSDQATLVDPDVRASVEMAIELAAHNARLRSDLADQLAEVAASRRRLLDAGLRERQELGARVEVEVARPLERLAHDLDAMGVPFNDRVGQHVTRAADELAVAQVEIAHLAAGLYPRVLAESGLAAALRDLAERAPVPVDVDVPDALTGGSEVDATVYFVCAEALANAARHARASQVGISASLGASTVSVVIADDGAGGADMTRGTGLRGLRDRVETVGGTLSLESPPGTGTRLAATIPVSPEARGLT